MCIRDRYLGVPFAAYSVPVAVLTGCNSLLMTGFLWVWLLCVVCASCEVALFLDHNKSIIIVACSTPYIGLSVFRNLVAYTHVCFILAAQRATREHYVRAAAEDLL